MTDIVQPVPITPLPIPPRPTDTPEEFDAKSFATLEAQEVMVPQVNAAADATWKNALSGKESATQANQSKLDAEGLKSQAQTAANNAGASAAVVARWDRLVLGPKSYFPSVGDDGLPLLVGAEFYHTVLQARYSWSGTAWMIGTNVTAGVSSVNGRAGPVTLSMADVAPGSVVAYGSDKAAARAAIDAGLDYARGRQTFTASQTISKSMFGTATWVLVELWAGGQAGRWMINTSGSAPGYGGEGGDYRWAIFRISDIPDGAQLIVGAGGARLTSPANSANSGGDSSYFGLVAYGGGNPNNARNVDRSGGEGGAIEGSGLTNRKVNAIDGGAGGGAAGAGTRSPAGVSVRGGNGGAEFVTTVSGGIGNDGAAPGGGGGGAWLNAPSGVITSGGGGPGRAEFTWW